MVDEHPLPETERERWQFAASLLDWYDDADIVGYLGRRLHDCRKSGNSVEAQRWLDFTLQVEALLEQRSKPVN